MFFLTFILRDTRAIHIHQLSKKLSQRIPFKLHGLPVTSVFHPTRSIFFVSTKKNVRVYDLLKQRLIKKLETGLREVSSIAVHPGGYFSGSNIFALIFNVPCQFFEIEVCLCSGDNVIVGSKEGKMCWFDMDLSSKPYRTLKYVSMSLKKSCL